MAVKRLPDAIVIQQLVKSKDAENVPPISVPIPPSSSTGINSEDEGEKKVELTPLNVHKRRAPTPPKRSVSLHSSYTGSSNNNNSKVSTPRTLRRQALERPLPLIPLGKNSNTIEARTRALSLSSAKRSNTCSTPECGRRRVVTSLTATSPLRRLPKVKSLFRPAHNAYHHQVCLELLGTEESYIQDLETAIERLGDINNNKDKLVINKITKSLEEIRQFSVQLLEDMCGSSLPQPQEIDQVEGIARTFINHANQMQEIYIRYCAEHQEIVAIESGGDNNNNNNTTTSPTSWTSSSSSPLTWDLQSMLIKPVQRISKYPLFLQNLAEYDDKCAPTILESLECMREILGHINTELKKTSTLLEHSPSVTSSPRSGGNPLSSRRRLSLGVAKVAGILKSVGQHGSASSSNTSSLIMSPMESPIRNIPKLPTSRNSGDGRNDKHKSSSEMTVSSVLSEEDEDIEVEKNEPEHEEKVTEIEESPTKNQDKDNVTATDELASRIIALIQALESYLRDVYNYLSAQTELARRCSNSCKEKTTKLLNLAQHIGMVLFLQLKSLVYIHVTAPLEQGLCMVRASKISNQSNEIVMEKAIEGIYQSCLTNFSTIESNWHSTVRARIQEMFPRDEQYNQDIDSVLNRYYSFINE